MMPKRLSYDSMNTTDNHTTANLSMPPPASTADTARDVAADTVALPPPSPVTNTSVSLTSGQLEIPTRDLTTLPSNTTEKHQLFRVSQWFRIRWLITFSCMILLLALTAIRVNLSLAIVAMINKESETESGWDPKVAKEHLRHHINWSETQKDHILEAVFIGMVISSGMSGRLAETVGPRKVSLGSVTIASLLSLTFPEIAKTSYAVAYISRVLQGICVGAIPPCTAVLISRWAPTFEKSILSSCILMGAMVGNAGTHTAVGYLSKGTFFGGWPSVFYVVGALNLTALVLCFLLVFDDPEQHPFISDYEKNFILERRSYSSSNSHTKFPWAKVVCSPAMYALLIADASYGWFIGFTSTQLPSFYHDIVGLDHITNGKMISFAYVTGIIVSLSSGYLVDLLRQKTKLGTTILRKILTFTGLVGSAVCLILLTFFEDNKMASIALISTSKAIVSLYIVGGSIVPIDMSPTFSGSIMGIALTIRNMAAFLINEAAALIIGDDKTAEAWARFIYFAAGFGIIGAVAFVSFGSAEIQSWDPVSKKKEGNSDSKDNELSTIAPKQ